jgi:hypothetical protein
MLWKAMLLLTTIVIVGIAIVPLDAFAIDCSGLAPHKPCLLDQSVVGCYGFDHGPIYLPHRCNFSYPCEYYGTCKRARRDSISVDKILNGAKPGERERPST